MATQYVCDICGKITGGMKYVVPVYDRKVLHSKLDGKNPTIDEQIKIGEVNLCDQHKRDLARFLSIIQD